MNQTHSAELYRQGEPEKRLVTLSVPRESARKIRVNQRYAQNTSFALRHPVPFHRVPISQCFRA